MSVEMKWRRGDREMFAGMESLAPVESTTGMDAVDNVVEEC